MFLLIRDSDDRPHIYPYTDEVMRRVGEVLFAEDSLDELSEGILRFGTADEILSFIKESVFWELELVSVEDIDGITLRLFR